MGDGEQGTRELGIYKTGNLDVRVSFNSCSLFSDFSISVLQTAFSRSLPAQSPCRIDIKLVLVR